MNADDKNDTKIVYTDDGKDGVSLLVRSRLPWLVVGLLGGLLASFFISRFEDVLSQNISLAFFLPLIVYMSDAVGTQTETIFVRNLSRGSLRFSVYLLKEFFVGILLGIVFGAATGLISYLWIQSQEIALTVGFAMFANVAIAPIVALVVPEILFKERTDPALGGGPFTTIIQDVLSILIYFTVASFLLFR